MENFDGIEVGTRLRVTGGSYDMADDAWHYIRTGAEVEVMRLSGSLAYVTPVNPGDWTSHSYSGADTNSVRAQDVERALPQVTLDDQWRPPVGTEVVIIAGDSTGDGYHSFPLGTLVTVDRVTGAGDSSHLRATGDTRWGRDSQWLRPGDYRLPDGVEAILPTPPLSEADALEVFKRKVVADALERRVRFGLNHGDMIDFLTNDLGLGAYLPGVKVQVTIEVEVPAGSTAEVRERAEAAVRRGEGTVQGRAHIVG